MKKMQKFALGTLFGGILQKFTSSTKTAPNTDTPISPDEPALDSFSIYDDLAVAVCDGRVPNDDYGMEFTNEELCGMICDCLDVDYFDLFEDVKPHEVEASEDPDVIQGHAFIYFLRYQVFAIALEQGIGDNAFSETIMAHSEMWFIRLTDRWNVLTNGGESDKTWMH